MPLQMTADEIKQWILVMFGAPAITPELQQIHLDTSVYNAVMWLGANRGQRKIGSFVTIANQNSYNLPEEVNRVLDVAFTSSVLDYSSVLETFVLPDQQLPYSAIQNPALGGANSSLVQLMQHSEMTRRILGSEQDWLQEEKVLTLFPMPRTAGTIIYTYSTSKITVEQLSARDHELLKRYALAEAKIILGRIRSRWNTAATAQGERGLDGQALLEEGRQEKEALNQEIKDTGGAPGIVIG